MPTPTLRHHFGAKFQRNIEELLVAPVPTHVIIAGYVGGGVARGLFVGILVTAISLFCAVSGAFVGIRCLNHGALAVLFSLAGLLNGVFAKTFDDISTVASLCVNATHVFGWGLLLTDFVAAVLARAVAPEPNRLYDQWFPLRLPRYQ